MNNENQNFNQIPVPPNNGMPTPNPNLNSSTLGVDSLGSMGTQNLDTLNTPMPTPMPEPIPNTNPVNLNPPGMIPPVEPTSPAPAASPLMGTTLEPNQNQTQNMMNNSYMNTPGMDSPVPPVNNMSMFDGVPVPPIPPSEPSKEKKKGKMNKPILIVLIVVLIAAVGFGVYYFLVLSKQNATSVTSKLSAEWELGEPLAENVLNYVNLTGLTSSQCSLTTNVNVNKTGTYEWTVTCGNKKVSDKLTVKDTTAPEVVTKDVAVVPNTEISPEDFIESAYDASESEEKISYTFVDEAEFDLTQEGTYTVTIEASDAYQNTVNVTANLIVTNDAPVHDLVCSYEEISKAYPTATVNVRFRYAITTSNTVYDNVKIVEYIFDEQTYEEALDDVTDDGFDGLTGKVTKDDTHYKITVEIPITADILNEEFKNTTFPDTESEIQKLHESRGDYCYIEE